ncbi:hypothetical protein JD276_06070 [Leucobacter sp. CSA1]|uniref:DUF7882 domain-containing protein n=1 Tax=Leucobacter chromiisoli TaxID=2796471 RepID=A0A934Q8H4_9MICO|nr:hypothetical protein [Leucobacter chromiisoli]MBK0418599.1 hypothetical protein [Leucobacter chromiisoli]
MGYLRYGQHQPFQFDDRTLTHLRVVITGKFVLQESFVFTWTDEGLQRSIWMHPSHTLTFEFESAETPPVNREWIELLMGLANSPAGLRLAKEPEGHGHDSHH